MDFPPEVTAKKKHPCPACGGESIWNPAKQALVCPFCGTTTEVEATPDEIIEHDLAEALSSIPDESRGWQAEKKSVKCQHCQAISVFDPARVAQRCDFCGAAQLVPYEESTLPFRPESLLPLKVSESQSRDILRSWIKKVWFAPNNLSRLTRTDSVTGIYLPFWTFDAQAESDWHADAGYYYYTSENYKDSQGNTRSRQVQHTRWESAHGHASHFFDDELVPASRGVPPHLVNKVGPFPTKDLLPYSPSYLTGWIVEHYQIDLLAAAQTARERMISDMRTMCSREVPGDTQRNLQVDTQFSGQTFKHILAPVWLMTYTYRARSYQVLVNGCSGKVSGDYPKSWVKITLAVLGAVIIFVVALVVISALNSTSGTGIK
jgi:ribosomal protein S27E